MIQMLLTLEPANDFGRAFMQRLREEAKPKPKPPTPPRGAVGEKGWRQKVNQFVGIAHRNSGIDYRALYVMGYHEICKKHGVSPVVLAHRKGFKNHLDALELIEGSYDTMMDFLCEVIEKGSYVEH